MDTFTPLAVFALVASITPGPNNMMLSASGIAFGFRRTVPHLFGVWTGFLLLLVICATGAGALMERFPSITLSIRVLGSAYLLHLAWKMRDAFDAFDSQQSARPLYFHEAFAFQFINPKGWVMCVTAASLFTSESADPWVAIVMLCGIVALINLPCISSWAMLGATLRPWLAAGRRRRALGIVAALLMAYSVAALWI